MGIATLPPIVTIYRQAMRTFDDKKSKKEFEANMSKLKGLMDKVTAKDLGLDERIISPEYWETPNKSPCTYIEVFQNEHINMSIFVLKPGFQMPMHDHPQMHGFLKVIAGAVNVRSFTEYPLKEVGKIVDFATRAKFEASRIASGLHKRRRLFAEVSVSQVCSASSGTCVLTPTLSNYHEIQALSLPAAFFDILAPPYDTFIKEVGPRRCKYYEVANEISTNVVELQEIEVPKCFHCDQAPYLGPAIV